MRITVTVSVSEEGGWAVIASLLVDLMLACCNAQREREYKG